LKDLMPFQDEVIEEEVDVSVEGSAPLTQGPKNTGVRQFLQKQKVKSTKKNALAEMVAMVAEKGAKKDRIKDLQAELASKHEEVEALRAKEEQIAVDEAEAEEEILSWQEECIRLCVRNKFFLEGGGIKVTVIGAVRLATGSIASYLFRTFSMLCLTFSLMMFFQGTIESIEDRLEGVPESVEARKNSSEALMKHLYVTVTFNKHKSSTKVNKVPKNPIWNENFGKFEL